MHGLRNRLRRILRLPRRDTNNLSAGKKNANTTVSSVEKIGSTPLGNQPSL